MFFSMISSQLLWRISFKRTIFLVQDLYRKFESARYKSSEIVLLEGIEFQTLRFVLPDINTCGAGRWRCKTSLIQKPLPRKLVLRSIIQKKHWERKGCRSIKGRRKDNLIVNFECNRRQNPHKKIKIEFYQKSYKNVVFVCIILIIYF